MGAINVSNFGTARNRNDDNPEKKLILKFGVFYVHEELTTTIVCIPNFREIL